MMKINTLIIVIIMSAINSMQSQETKIKSMLIASDAFADGENIPEDYACFSCRGKNFSPPLSWEKIDNAVSYALICEDPDVPNGPYIHWIVFNLPGTVTSLPANANIAAIGGMQGTNTQGDASYTGPCPPRKIHRYYFTVWALDSKLDLDSSVTVTPFKKALEGHVIAKGTFMGRFICK